MYISTYHLPFTFIVLILFALSIRLYNLIMTPKIWTELDRIQPCLLTRLDDGEQGIEVIAVLAGISGANEPGIPIGVDRSKRSLVLSAILS